MELSRRALASRSQHLKTQKDVGQTSPESSFLMSPEKGKLAVCWVAELGSGELGSEPDSGLLVRAAEAALACGS